MKIESQEPAKSVDGVTTSQMDSPAPSWAIRRIRLLFIAGALAPGLFLVWPESLNLRGPTEVLAMVWCQSTVALLAFWTTFTDGFRLLRMVALIGGISLMVLWLALILYFSHQAGFSFLEALRMSQLWI